MNPPDEDTMMADAAAGTVQLGPSGQSEVAATPAHSAAQKANMLVPAVKQGQQQQHGELAAGSDTKATVDTQCSASPSAMDLAEKHAIVAPAIAAPAATQQATGDASKAQQAARETDPPAQDKVASEAAARTQQLAGALDLIAAVAADAAAVPAALETKAAAKATRSALQAFAAESTDSKEQPAAADTTATAAALEHLQKWVQCAACNKWRKVPYSVNDDELTDDWQCKDNIWDSACATCEIPQALTDEEIDRVLALQEDDLAAIAAQAASKSLGNGPTADRYEGAYGDADGEPAAYDEDTEDDVAAARSGPGGSSSRGFGRGSSSRGRRIPGAAASHLVGGGIGSFGKRPRGSSPASQLAADAAAVAAAVFAGGSSSMGLEGGSRPRGGRNSRGGGRWGNRRGGSKNSGGSSRGTAGPNQISGNSLRDLTAAAGGGGAADIDEITAEAASAAAAAVAAAAAEAAAAAALAGPDPMEVTTTVTAAIPPAAAAAAGSGPPSASDCLGAADLGEAAEALLGMGMDLEARAAPAHTPVHREVGLADLMQHEQQQLHNTTHLLPGHHSLDLSQQHHHLQNAPHPDQHHHQHLWPLQQQQPLQCPRSLLRPGKVVWAKVEGHDWWPARVVRRRAVPKEVGAPPGGPVAVLDSIPVVFFTAKGIPGEVDECLDTPAGLVAAGMRALGLGDDTGDDEAEYAWLPYDNIKPFTVGDVSGNQDGKAPEDPVLLACVQAAEAALLAAAGLGPQQQQPQVQQECGGEDDMSDSDGGWGPSKLPPLVMPPPPRHCRGRSRGSRLRGKRSGRGSSRGGMRGGRGRFRGLTPDDDEYSDSDGWSGQDAAAAAAGVNGGAAVAAENSLTGGKTVECILAWRMPLSEQERQQGLAQKKQQQQARIHRWQAIKQAVAAGIAPLSAIAARAAVTAGASNEAAAATAASVQQQQPAAEAKADLAAQQLPATGTTGTADTGPATTVTLADAGTGSAPDSAAKQSAAQSSGAATAKITPGEVTADRSAAPDCFAAPDGDVQMSDAPALENLQQQQQSDVATTKPATTAAAGDDTDLQLAQEEADAAAALLGFGTEDRNAVGRLATASVFDAATAAATPVDVSQQVGAEIGDQLSCKPFNQEPAYLVKWAGKAHIHNDWLPESQLLSIARRKLVNFRKQHGDAPVSFMEDEWLQPQKFVARRPALSSPGWEVLVKWKGQGYDACTWENEQCSALMEPEHMQLHLDLWDRQHKAIARASEEAKQTEQALREAAGQQLIQVEKQPLWVHGAALHPHQLQALQWLRAAWASKHAAVLADEQGLGNTASCIAYISSLINEFKVTAPVLVVVPLSMLAFWEGELAFWAPPETQVLTYSGCVAARSIMAEHELWLQPSSMDGKISSGGRTGLPARVPKPQVLLATYEAMCSDVHVLSGMQWASIVVDRRQRTRSAAGKSQAALQELSAGHRVVLSPHGLQCGTEQLFELLQFAKPGEDVADMVPASAAEPEQQVAHLAALLEPLTLQRCLRDIRDSANSKLSVAEVQLQVDYAPVQAEVYKTILARSFEVLTDPEPPRLTVSRGAQLRKICGDLKKVCQHPFLLPEFELDRSTDAPGAAAATGQPTAGATSATDPTPAAAEQPAVLGDDLNNDAEWLAATIAGSGKMQLLDLMLEEFRSQGQQVLVTAHSLKALELIAEYARIKLGPASFEFIDLTMPAAERYAAVQRFNAAAAVTQAAPEAATVQLPLLKDTSPSAAAAGQQQQQQQEKQCPQQPFLILITPRSLGLGTELLGLSAVVIFESDWHPRLDIQALHRAHRAGQPGRLAVLRLVLRHSVDERLLQLADRRKPLDAMLRPGSARCSLSGVKTLEDVIRWGTSKLFSTMHDSDAAAAGVVTAAPEGKQDQQQQQQPAAGGDVDMAGAASNAGVPAAASQQQEQQQQQRQALLTADDAGTISHAVGVASAQSQLISYSRKQVQQLVLRAAAACAAVASSNPAATAEPTSNADAAAAACAAASTSFSDLEPGLGTAAVRVWTDVDKPVEGSAEGADEPEAAVAADPATADTSSAGFGVSLLTRSDGAAASSLYWSNLLRGSWETLHREEGVDVSAQGYIEHAGSEGTAVGDRDNLSRRSRSAGWHVSLMDTDGYENEDGIWDEGLEGDSEEDYGVADYGGLAGQQQQQDPNLMQQGSREGLDGDVLQQYASRVSGNFGAYEGLSQPGLVEYGEGFGLGRGGLTRTSSRGGGRTGSSKGGRAGAAAASSGGRGAGAGGKGARRRRTDDDTFYTPPGTTVAAELLRMASLGGGHGGSGAYGEDRPAKKRKRGGGTAGGGWSNGGFGGSASLDEQFQRLRGATDSLLGPGVFASSSAAAAGHLGHAAASAGGNGRTAAGPYNGFDHPALLGNGLHIGGGSNSNGGGRGSNGSLDDAGAGGPEAARALRLQGQVVREFVRMEAVKAACGEPGTIEHAIAGRAFQRIEAIAQELCLDGDIMAMACQAAEILMVMRQDDEVPSDFQDYSLVTLVGVAAHLMHQPLGNGEGMELLAAKYGHDVKALDQVFWHILTKLAYYRELTLRVDQLVAKGLLDPTALAAAAAAAAAGVPEGDDFSRLVDGVSSDRPHIRGGHAGAAQAAAGPGDRLNPNAANEVDSFGAKLDSILAADLTNAALSQGSLDTIPLGPLATLMPLLQMAGQLNDPAIKSALKQVRESQESMVLLDRTHTLKVQQIQKEYQDFMERIRNKAQGAIDTANRDYQSRKAMYSARITIMVDYLNQALPLQQLQAAAQHIQRATAAAAAAAAVGGTAAGLSADAAAAAAAAGLPSADVIQAAATAAAAAAAAAGAATTVSAGTQQSAAGGVQLGVTAVGPTPQLRPAASIGHNPAIGGGAAAGDALKAEVLAAAASGGSSGSAAGIAAGLSAAAAAAAEQQAAAEIIQAIASGRLTVEALPEQYKGHLLALLQRSAAEQQAAAAAVTASPALSAAAVVPPSVVLQVQGAPAALGMPLGFGSDLNPAIGGKAFSGNAVAAAVPGLIGVPQLLSTAVAAGVVPGASGTPSVATAADTQHQQQHLGSGGGGPPANKAPAAAAGQPQVAASIRQFGHGGAEASAPVALANTTAFPASVPAAAGPAAAVGNSSSKQAAAAAGSSTSEATAAAATTSLPLAGQGLNLVGQHQALTVSHYPTLVLTSAPVATPLRTIGSVNRPQNGVVVGSCGIAAGIKAPQAVPMQQQRLQPPAKLPDSAFQLPAVTISAPSGIWQLQQQQQHQQLQPALQLMQASQQQQQQLMASMAQPAHSTGTVQLLLPGHPAAAALSRPAAHVQGLPEQQRQQQQQQLVVVLPQGASSASILPATAVLPAATSQAAAAAMAAARQLAGPRVIVPPASALIVSAPLAAAAAPGLAALPSAAAATPVLGKLPSQDGGQQPAGQVAPGSFIAALQDALDADPAASATAAAAATGPPSSRRSSPPVATPSGSCFAEPAAAHPAATAAAAAGGSAAATVISSMPPPPPVAVSAAPVGTAPAFVAAQQPGSAADLIVPVVTVPSVPSCAGSFPTWLGHNAVGGLSSAAATTAAASLQHVQGQLQSHSPTAPTHATTAPAAVAPAASAAESMVSLQGKVGTATGSVPNQAKLPGQQ